MDTLRFHGIREEHKPNNRKSARKNIRIAKTKEFIRFEVVLVGGVF